MTYISPESRYLMRHAAVAGAAGVLAAATMTALAFNAWVIQTTRERIFDELDDVPERDVAIVLGGRVYATRRVPTIALAARLQTALELYRAAKIERILVSGAQGSPVGDDVSVMHRWLLGEGVNPRDLDADPASRTTAEILQRARTLFGVRRAVICTQRFHLPRALYLADASGIDAVGAVADPNPEPIAEYYALRESAQRIAAVLDAYRWQREQHFWGAPSGASPG